MPYAILACAFLGGVAIAGGWEGVSMCLSTVVNASSFVLHSAADIISYAGSWL